MIIGLVGFINCGKGTVSNILINEYGFKQESFASSVKDSCSYIFNWPRHLLEGDTQESREWRETVDTWWSEKLNIKHFTPRKALQFFGTDVMRNHFHENIWLLSLENKLLKSKNNNIVISDVRFSNELQFLKKIDAKLIRIKRGPDPDWFKIAEIVNTYDNNSEEWKNNKIILDSLNLHTSETSWIGSDFHFIIENDGTIDDLKKKLQNII